MTGRERKQTQPSYTVAGVLEGDTITFGIAVCSREDSFSKETGRKLALKNLDIKTKVTLSDHVVKNMGIGKYFVAKAKRLIEKG
jgi:hypothetical protein